MSEPSLLELLTAAVIVVAIVAVAWRATDWLSNRGFAVRPGTLMDRHMDRVEDQMARKEATARSGSIKNFPSEDS